MSSNFWQIDLEAPVVQSPVAILQEQSVFLGEKTGGQIVGEVVQDEEYDETGRFFWMMYLRAPALGNYRFRLLSIEHSTDFYPLHLRVDEAAFEEILEAPHQVEPEYRPITKIIFDRHIRQSLNVREQVAPVLEIETEQEFLCFLKTLFNTKRVAKVISAIRAQIAT